jgi:hypothetical protein
MSDMPESDKPAGKESGLEGLRSIDGRHDDCLSQLTASNVHALHSGAEINGETHIITNRKSSRILELDRLCDEMALIFGAASFMQTIYHIFGQLHDIYNILNNVFLLTC